MSPTLLYALTIADVDDPRRTRATARYGGRLRPIVAELHGATLVR